jgi:hypothetical protein
MVGKIREQTRSLAFSGHKAISGFAPKFVARPSRTDRTDDHVVGCSSFLGFSGDRP